MGFYVSSKMSLFIANVVWPALYTETKLNSFPIIALSLLVEFFFFRSLFGQPSKKALIYTITANVASGVVGLLGRPLSGLLYEVTIGMVVMWLFDWGTFNPVAWCFVPVFGGALNAFLEILAIRLIWKHKFSRKHFLWLWLANIITIALATAWVVIDPPQL